MINKYLWSYLTKNIPLRYASHFLTIFFFKPRFHLWISTMVISFSLCLFIISLFNVPENVLKTFRRVLHYFLRQCKMEWKKLGSVFLFLFRFLDTAVEDGKIKSLIHKPEIITKIIIRKVIWHKSNCLQASD